MTRNEIDRVVCRCQEGRGPGDVELLIRTLLALHERDGCTPAMLGVIGRLYGVVADNAACHAGDGTGASV